MMFRAIGYGAILSVALAAGPPAFAEPACDGDTCPAVAQQTSVPSKPLDIMKFMREQAASTRATNPSRAKAVKRAAHPTRPKVAARPKPAAPTRAAETAQIKQSKAASNEESKPPAQAPSPFPSQPEQSVQVVNGDEINAIDRAADAPRAETVGAASPIAGPMVEVVDSQSINDIDRKAEDSAPPAANPEPANARPAPQDAQPSRSWLSRIWSAVGGTFAALASAVHNLIG